MLGMFGKSVDECISEFYCQNKNIFFIMDFVGGVMIDFLLFYCWSIWLIKCICVFFDMFVKFSVSFIIRNKVVVVVIFLILVFLRLFIYLNELIGFWKDVF